MLNIDHSLKDCLKTNRLAQVLSLMYAVVFCGCSQLEDENIQAERNNFAEVLKDASYVDDAICAQCHQEIYDSYQDVAMAKSFYDFKPEQAIESFDDNQFFHAASGNHYQMNAEDDGLRMTRYRLRADGTKYAQFEQTAKFVVGSGNHVRTYLTRNDIGEMYQLPIVWYSQEKKWGMAPGYDRPDHLDFSRPITRQCLFCHNAYPDFEAGSDLFGMPHLFPKNLPQGIGCQRCHGPGSEHVRISNEFDSDTENGQKRIQASIVNSKRLSPELQDDVCNQCHFQPMSQRTSFVRKFSKGDYGYRPGQPLADYMLHFEPDRDNDRADHFEINHHPYRLFQSQCYIKTPGGIRCTDCHDPHQKIEKSQQASFYREKCFSCHENQDCLDVERGRKADADCIACHMTTRRTTDVVNVTMTDHKISRRPRLKDPTAPLKEIDVPIEMPIKPYVFEHRDLQSRSLRVEEQKIYSMFARALDDDESVVEPLTEAVSRSASQLEPRLQLAQLQLEARDYGAALSTLDAFTEKPDLALFHINLGVSQVGVGQLNEAESELELATERSPNNPNAWYNLATVKQRQRDFKGANECLDKATALRPNYSLAFRKKGTLAAIQEKYDLAFLYLQKTIAINPRDLSSYHRLAAAYRLQSNFSNAIQVLEDALTINAKDDLTMRELVWTLLDADNLALRNSKRAADLAQQLWERKAFADTTLTLAIAMIDDDRTKEALQMLGRQLPELEKESRKPEAGLLLGLCQLKLNSIDSARQNFAAASKAMQAKKNDRLGRLILKIATAQFSKK